jgi:NAD+ diphosphatase
VFHEIHPKQFSITYHNTLPKSEDVFIGFRAGEVLYAMDEEKVRLPLIKERIQQDKTLSLSSFIYLFSIDDTGYFTLLDIHTDIWDTFSYHFIRDLRTLEPKHLAYAAAVGYQLWDWYGKNRFCGRCGESNVLHPSERAILCPICHNTLYPVIPPSVIVAVTNGAYLLLTKYQPVHNPYPNYTLVAGYIEAGESAEDAVKREVMEEVGLRVKNIRYYKSQPWPFSGSLLFGFFCELDGEDTVSLDIRELSEAVWMHRDNIPAPISLISLTSEMIECFRNGNESMNFS